MLNGTLTVRLMKQENDFIFVMKKWEIIKLAMLKSLIFHYQM